MNNDSPDSVVLPDDIARALLARAAELDVQGGEGLTLAQLRVAASQAGIAHAAFDKALDEYRAATKAPDARARGWSGAWNRVAVRAFARFLPSWAAVMGTIGVLSGTVFEPAYGPVQLGLLTIASFAVTAGHLLALLLTTRSDTADSRTGSLQSSVTAMALPFVFVGLQLSQVITSPMSVRSTTVIWFIISALLSLVVSAIANPGRSASASQKISRDPAAPGVDIAPTSTRSLHESLARTQDTWPLYAQQPRSAITGAA